MSDRDSQITETMLGLEPTVKADLLSRVFFHCTGAELTEEQRTNLLRHLNDPGVDLSISQMLAAMFELGEKERGAE